MSSPSEKPATTAKGPSRRAPLYLMRSLRISGENCLSNGFVRRVAASKSDSPSTRTRWSSRRAITSLSVPTWLRSPHELSCSRLAPKELMSPLWAMAQSIEANGWDQIG